MNGRKSYAVVWRGADGIARPGRLTLGAAAIRFEGGRGALNALTLPYDDVRLVRVASPRERIGGHPTLVLQREPASRSVRLASVGSTGALSELVDLLDARLSGRPAA
ncbi:MAG TPA: hypothetical protein VG479_03645 [Gaiellaceae bacterium]|nr:hypothetical protein [Gaiellaceae bacterium]